MANDLRNFLTGALGGYSQVQQRRQQSQQELQTEIFKEMIKARLNSQMIKEQMLAYKDLVGSGKFKVSMGPTGFTFNPISADEQLKNIQAEETLSQAGYGDQVQFNIRQNLPQNGQLRINPSSNIPANLQNILQSTQQQLPQSLPVVNRNVGGGGLLQVLRQQKIAEKQAEEELKLQMQAKAGRKMGRVNVNIVGGAFKRLAQTYADATKEGATGDIYRQTFAKNIALGGLIPRGMGGRGLQEKFRRTAAYEGQKTEVITKMMPMLTQQGDKPGSVRLIRSIFDRLSKTIPELKHDVGPATEMIAESMKNMYGFAAAVENAGGMNKFVEQLGYNPNVLGGLSQQQLNNLADNAIQGIYNGALGISIGLTPAQEQELNSVLEQVLAPINALTQGQGSYRVLRQVR